MIIKNECDMMQCTIHCIKFNIIKVDFPDVVQRKKSLIQSNKDLQKLIPGLQSQGEKGNPLIG